jgi:nitroreductase
MSRLMDLIRARVSVRAFDAREVTAETIASVVEAARLAPSACNAQPWRFVALTDPALRKTFVRECLGGLVPNRWAALAPAFLVACAERKVMPHLLAEPVAGIPYHILDLGIAMEHVVLRAQELGLGSCYIGWFSARSVHRLLGLPRGWKVVCLMALGYASGPAAPRERLPLDRILFFNRLPKATSTEPAVISCRAPSSKGDGS